MLGRDTEWRQGDLLSDEVAYSLELVERLGSNRRVVLISHDCDLPNDTELFVEVIVGSLIPTRDPMVTHARNPRRLHLTYVSDERPDMTIELRHIDRQQINKAKFAQITTRDINLLLHADEKRALKQWLAARYGRPAFPNAFENRLRKIVGKKSVEHHIAKILKPESSYLVALFFDLGEHRAIELEHGAPYFLSISVVYNATGGGAKARGSAEKVARELRTLFDSAYGAPEYATEIELSASNAVADTLISLADLLKVDQWRLEYISLSEEPMGDFLPTGATPV